MGVECQNCGRAPVMRNTPRCAYCGGPLAEASETQQSTASQPPGGTATGGTATGGMPPVREPAPPRRMAPPPEPLPEPTLGQKILGELFGTPNRRWAAFAVLFVVFGYLALSSLINHYAPKPESSEIAIYTNQEDMKAGMRYDMEKAQQSPALNARRQKNAHEALNQIATALERYAAQHKGFPYALSDDLHELADFGGPAGPIEHFSGGKLSAYDRSISPDRTTQSLRLEAKVAVSEQPISTSVEFSLDAKRKLVTR